MNAETRGVFMKKIIRIISLMLAVMFVFSACSSDYGNKAKTDESKKVLFTMQNGATFVIETYPEYAPRTCENFINLVESGFYDGLTFHRIVEGFVAQGGDPKGDGTGDSGKRIIGEFAANGHQNNLSHTRGVVSMARGNSNNSASCQFFICFDDCSSSLDGNYAAFGKVIKGMENVDAFLNVQREMGDDGENSSPVTPIVIASARVITDEEYSEHTQGEIITTPETVPVSATEEETAETTTKKNETVLGGITTLTNERVRFTMSDGSSFVIETYPAYAPATCQNFIKLVNEGFYDGLTFHRIVDGFVAQGGDPKGDGTGGSDETIPGEFAYNGFDKNTLSHQRGVVSMARKGNDMDSATSQFFICYEDCSASLDGKYAAFGKVVEGMETVDAFLEVERTNNGGGEISKPTTPIVIEKAEVIS